MFTLPTFNLKCNVWRWGDDPVSDPPTLTNVDCNLALGRRGYVMEEIWLVSAPTFLSIFLEQQLLLPKGTDVRGQNSISGADTVEVPAGSGAYYVVRWVANSGSGFSNEHRLAIVNQIPPFVDPLPVGA